MIFLTGIFTFIATELDDFAVFVLLFATRKKSGKLTFLGQLLALMAVTSACILVSLPLSRIDQRYLRWAGVIPILFGIKEIAEGFFRKDDEKNETNDEAGETKEKRHGSEAFTTAFSLTIAASADNVGIYLPYFANLSVLNEVLTALIFALCQAGWSFLQFKTASIPAVQNFVEKTSRILVPAVFILLGLSIIF